MERFGEFLKVHREKKGIRLEEIASITKINLRSLELLEASEWNELPPEPFIRGFIIAYAKYVGLETKEVLERYFGETGQHAAAVATPASEPLPQPPSQLASDVIEQGRPLPSGALLIAAGVALVIGFVTIVVYIGKHGTHATEPSVADSSATPGGNSGTAPGKIVEAAKAAVGDNRVVASPKDTPSADAKTSTATTTAPAVAKETAKAPTPAPEPKFAHEVVIEAKDRTWARVIIDEQAPQKVYLREGDKVVYTAKEKLKVVLGNGTNSKVHHNGKLVYGFKAGEMLRAYRFPSSAKFPQDNAARRAAAARSEDDRAEGSGADPNSPALPEKPDAPYIPPTE